METNSINMDKLSSLNQKTSSICVDLFSEKNKTLNSKQNIDNNIKPHQENGSKKQRPDPPLKDFGFPPWNTASNASSRPSVDLRIGRRYCCSCHRSPHLQNTYFTHVNICVFICLSAMYGIQAKQLTYFLVTYSTAYRRIRMSWS